MLQIQMRILRVFGLSKAEMNSIIENARAEGSPSLRLQERDGEYLVCVQASAPTQAMADEYCEKWVQKLRTRFGDACYGFEDTTMAQAALDALLKKRRLLVAADEATGRLLGNALRGLQHSEAAFDFGNQTYLNPANARRIAAPEALLKKFPGDMVQAAAGRAQSALLLANADYAAVYMPATVGQAPFVLLCSRIGAAACALSPEISDMAIANHILDLARRRALGLHLGPSAITFKPGRERPLLLVSGEGQPRPGSRFTLRRKAPPKPAPQPRGLDSYDEGPAPDYDAQPAAPKPQAAPTGAITFERPAAQPAVTQQTPDPLDLHTAGPQAAAEARARRAAENGLDPDLELCATRTIKISRADLEQAMAAQQAAKQQEQPKPEPPAAPQPEPQPMPVPEPPADLPKPKASILDDDIPDFAAGLDPEALEEARKADEKAPPRSTDEFQRAASQLFEEDEDDEEDEDEPAMEAAGRKLNFARKKQAEDEEPTITFPGRSKAKPVVPRPLAAKQEPKQDAIHNRSLAMIERAERRHRRKAIAAVAIVALLVLVGGAVLLGLTRSHTVEAPAYKNYGTEQFDTQAQAYLKSAAAANDKIIGYLAFPGQNGQLVYSGSQPGDGAAISGTNYLNASMPSNTVLSCADASLASLADQANFSQNAEFTLYLHDAAYHFRAVAVYNTDAAGTENAFTPASYGDLSDYYSYAEFSQNIKDRSLFDTGNTPGDKETFLTLMSTGGTNGTFVCVTAVLVPDQAQ